MSIDFAIYGKGLDRFDPKSFEKWVGDRGYDLELHPEFCLTEGGFQPIRIGGALSGMEIDLDEYVPEPVYVRQTFFERLLGKKRVLTAFSEKTREADQVIWLSCSGMEPLEAAAAHLLGAYFCERFGALFDDPQTGCMDSEAKVILITAAELLEEGKRSGGHPFRGWDSL